MAAPRNRTHLLVFDPPRSEGYLPYARKMSVPKYSGPDDRTAHAAQLRQSLSQIQHEALDRRNDVQITLAGAPAGIVVEFLSPPGFDLKLESLQSKRAGIELLNVRIMNSDDAAERQIATVFIPDGALKHFFDRFQQYADTVDNDKPRHADLVERIAGLRNATLHALWTDAEQSYPADGETIWWEIWLRRHDGKEMKRLHDFARQADVIVSERRLGFDDRIVVLVKGTSDQLSASLDVLNDFAELRQAKETATFFVDNLAPFEQSEWAEDLKNRTVLPAENSPAVCILDTGVSYGHLLLKNILAPGDATTVDPKWGVHDNHGHGTQMAGLAAYGDLTDALESQKAFQFRNRLESVKILPDVEETSLNCMVPLPLRPWGDQKSRLPKDLVYFQWR